MIPLDYAAVNTQTIDAPWLSANAVQLNVLRLDKIHDIISGNKFFKLKYYLQEAQQQHATTIATFGGAWSNHIAATAYACKLANISCVGIIRGEEPATPSLTLQQAQQHGMKIIYVSRQEYKDKNALMNKHPGWYFIPEGGFGQTGAKGASEILSSAIDHDKYSHIIAAVGTGTMLAGIINSAQQHQHIIGISSMKGNTQLHEDVRALTAAAVATFEINHDYHFGGYGKHPPELINFINKTYEAHRLPLDIVYTGKTFYAIQHMVEENAFAAGSKLLMIHSGGLQGNRSLPAQVLAF